MTSTAVINGQSVGTSTNIGNQKFATSATTLQSTTTAYVVALSLTNGATGPWDKNQVVRVWYTTSVYSIATAIPATFENTARYVDLRPRMTASGVRVVDSSLEPVTGQYFYCWADVPAQPSAATLTVTLVELP